MSIGATPVIFALNSSRDLMHQRWLIVLDVRAELRESFMRSLFSTAAAVSTLPTTVIPKKRKRKKVEGTLAASLTGLGKRGG